MGDNIVRRGRGRPKEDNTRDHDIRVRLDDREKYMLDRIIEATGDNTSDILRIALHGYFIHLKEVGRIE